MNVERWLKTRRMSWQKLEDLLKIVDGHGLKGLERDQLQELGRLYRATSADLSRARAMKLSGEVQVYLNNLVVRAHNQVYQNRRNRLSDIWNFFAHGFPELVQSYILYVVAAFIVFMIPALGCYREAVLDAHFGQMEITPGHALVPDEQWHLIEQHKMWTDSAQDYSPAVASFIATNNIKVTILAFAMGITFGIGTLIVLAFNGMNIGTVFGVCQDYGMAGRLAAFVAGHGVIELTAIFIAGGAGLLIGKSMLFPGQYKRIDALRMAARPAFKLFAGCVLLLLIAGTIEGFISPRTDIAPEVKYTVSLATAVCLILYLFAPRKKVDEETKS
ncbi:MAG: stage II sporulation protein M [Cyanobacteria bacterium SZAS TMP-1]|nr:stage II sporulation protein M [Cyanobacteria bacterium SZAS TMP-1]